MSHRQRLLLNCVQTNLSNEIRKFRSQFDHRTVLFVKSHDWRRQFHTTMFNPKERVAKDEVVIPKDSHYSILGVEAAASQEEIKAEYFKLSKIYHPDVNSSEESLRKFQQISAAYSIIGDVRLREEYDKKVLGIKRVVVPDGPSFGNTRIFLNDDDVDYTDNIYRKKQRDRQKTERVQWVPPTYQDNDSMGYDPMDDPMERELKKRVVLMKIKLKERQDPKKSGDFGRMERTHVDFDAERWDTGDFSSFRTPTRGNLQGGNLQGGNLQGGYYDTDPESRRPIDEIGQGSRMTLLLLIPVFLYTIYRTVSNSYFGYIEAGEKQMMQKTGRRIDGFPVRT